MWPLTDSSQLMKFVLIWLMIKYINLFDYKWVLLNLFEIVGLLSVSYKHKADDTIILFEKIEPKYQEPTVKIQEYWFWLSKPILTQKYTAVAITRSHQISTPSSFIAIFYSAWYPIRVIHHRVSDKAYFIIHKLIEKLHRHLRSFITTPASISYSMYITTTCFFHVPIYGCWWQAAVEE